MLEITNAELPDTGDLPDRRGQVYQTFSQCQANTCFLISVIIRKEHEVSLTHHLTSLSLLGKRGADRRLISREGRCSHAQGFGRSPPIRSPTRRPPRGPASSTPRRSSDCTGGPRNDGDACGQDPRPSVNGVSRRHS